jgi:hypothetical protein
MIVSPSDVNKERNICKNAIAKWNAINSEKYSIILNPIGWDINSYPETGDPPQDILNRQLLEKADILIALFWTRIGTPTKDYLSGSIEEISKHTESGKTTLIYFSNALVDLKSHDNDQYARLLEYKKNVKGYYKEYTSVEKFQEMISNDLQLLANDKLEGLFDKTENPEVLKKPEENHSRIKNDAIEFVSKMPEFKQNPKKVGEYFDILGNYRSLQLNLFFEKTGILKLIKNMAGGLSIKGSQISVMSDDDVRLVLENIKNGDYDSCF